MSGRYQTSFMEEQNFQEYNRRDTSAWQRSAETAPRNSNVIVNYLPPNLSEDEFVCLFSPSGTILHHKIVKDLDTDRSMGYGFIQFSSSEAAADAILKLNGHQIRGKQLKVSLARPSSNDLKRSNLYIVGLPLSWTKAELASYFSQFGQVIESRVLVDSANESRGVGFCRLDSHRAALNAISLCNGVMPPNGTSKLVIKLADNPTHAHKARNGGNDMAPGSQYSNGPKHALSHPQHQYNNFNSFFHVMPHQQHVNGNYPVKFHPQMIHMNMDMNGQPAPVPENQHFQGVCLFVYHLPLDASDQTLYQIFSPYATVCSTKVMKDLRTGRSKGFGFVNVLSEQDGQNAIQHLNNLKLGNKYIKISFKK